MERERDRQIEKRDNKIYFKELVNVIMGVGKFKNLQGSLIGWIFR